MPKNAAQRLDAKPFVWGGGLMAIAFVLALPACKNLKPVKGKASAVKQGDRVKVEFYVMSKCPFGTQVEKAIKPVLDEIGDSVDFHLDYIVNEANGTFTALHGQPEVDGNILQLCAIKHYPNPREYMKFIECQNQSMRQIPTGWERCAEQAGLAKDKIDSCFKGEEGKTLLRASMKRAKDAKAQGSPTIYIGGESYQGGRSKNDFMRAICGQMKSGKPDACAKIPEPVLVKATVLTDKRCKNCRVEGLQRTLKARFFPKLEIKTVDYSTPEGKKLYAKIGEKNLPLWLFEAGVEKAERYDQISRWMAAKGQYKLLNGMPRKFDPTAEICDNKQDDTGNGKVDCADETCKGTLACRTEQKNKLDVFVMSQCPFGVKAVNAMKEVLDNFGDKVAFDVHYIADKTGNGFKALHGQPEVDENIRQLCAKKYYAKGNKYLDYIWCRNKDYRSNDWKGCASNGISADKLEKCASGAMGKKLLEEDIKVAKALSFGASPTWLANNRYKFSGIAAEQIKTNICRYNPGLPNCDKTLSSGAKGGGGAQAACN